MKLLKDDKRKIQIGITILIVPVILAYLLFNGKSIGNALSTFMAIISPFIIGAALAFVLNMPMNFIENKLLKKWTSKPGLKRAISLLISLVIVSAILTFVVTLIIPNFLEAIKSLIQGIPVLVEKLRKYPEIAKQLDKIYDTYAITSTHDLFVKLKPYLTKNGLDILNNVFFGISTVFSVVLSFVVSFTFAIYLLFSKETLRRQFTELTYVFFSGKTAKRIIVFFKVAYEKFYSFFKGQFIEAFMLGFMCFIGMYLLKIPNAATVSVLIGFGALIPLVGAILGAALGALIILIESFSKAIMFVIFIIVLQQFDGNVTYPRIVGSSVGLPSIWVLVAVIIGAAVSGIVGMLIFVPIFATIYELLYRYKKKKLEDKNICIIEEK
ncbi:MAG: AI-2E family transporter [Finegoldia magna]|uniref:AI-2E family transporter n=2 Tax=Finegoldia magna TaxID=1260 RepID=A0A7D4KPE1_FINMA|nr:AI-2E family transporter [Finegoldia magna]EGS33985.1 putative membrane protein [Finegoldia magna SY403409CC001050417]MBS6927408.1 AI-2E family transporter [Finegoldia magna]MDU5442836.1 AI-2E family transporter [Finegoldia magna]MDU5526776.1 AI-2E family transporter [Finegoldia magna]QKH79683.1 AI-2E family transporter [Finegoldia magna]